MYNSFYMEHFIKNNEGIGYENWRITAFLVQLGFLLVKNEKCFDGEFVRKGDGVDFVKQKWCRMGKMSDEDAALVGEIVEFVKGCGRERLEAFVRWLIRDFRNGEEICMELLAFDLNERWERQEEERLRGELEKMVDGEAEICKLGEFVGRLKESVMRSYVYEGGRKYWLMELEKRREKRDRLEEIVRESNKRVENQLRNWRVNEV